jgi:hypothetical protein
MSGCYLAQAPGNTGRSYTWHIEHHRPRCSSSTFRKLISEFDKVGGGRIDEGELSFSHKLVVHRVYVSLLTYIWGVATTT